MTNARQPRLGNLISGVILATALGTSQLFAQLPDPGMEIVPGRTALVVTDPHDDFLSPDGVSWGVVGKSVENSFDELSHDRQSRRTD
jgi:hypothetical protein